MTVDPIDVRERVRSWTVAELRRAVQNRNDYADDEVAAAERELALRFSPLGEGTLTDAGGAADASMPIGMRVVLYLVCGVAVFSFLAVALFLSAFVTANANAGMIIVILLRFGLPAVLAAWAASAIHSEHSYARALLLSLLSVAIVARLAPMILAWEFTYGRVIIVAVLGVMFCYVAFSGAVRRYYRALKHIEGT